MPIYRPTDRSREGGSLFTARGEIQYRPAGLMAIPNDFKRNMRPARMRAACDRRDAARRGAAYDAASNYIGGRWASPLTDSIAR